MKRTTRFWRLWLAWLAVVSFTCVGAHAQQGVTIPTASDNPFGRISHIVVIYSENRSFDHVFGLFPGAEGINSAQHPPQVDLDGSPLKELPVPAGETRLPAHLPNAPFQIDKFIPLGARTIDPTHDFYIEQEQINGGRMDRFVEASSAGALVMGYYDGSSLKQWALAKEFTLADHFFHAAFGGSMLNHFFLVCACAPAFGEADEATRSKLLPALVSVSDGQGGERLQRARSETSPASILDGPPKFKNFGRLANSLEAVCTMPPATGISPFDDIDPKNRLPASRLPTIGERLSEKGVSWAWYAGGWNDVGAGRVKPNDDAHLSFQTHHQPFLYFAAYAEGMAGRDHLKDAEDFFRAADAGELPAVSFYKPIGGLTAHPRYSDILASDSHIGDVVARLRASPNWSDMLIVIAADENGGYWDHVAPPPGDRFGPGTRVPAIIVSPFARRGFVDPTVYDTTSILRTIEVRFGLAPLSSRDAKAADLRNALEQAP